MRRAKARYAALGKDLSTVRDRVQQYAAPLNVLDSEITMEVSPQSANPASYSTYSGTDSNGKNSVAGGDLIRITVNTPHRQLTRFFPFLNSYRLRSQVVFRREAN